MSEFEQDRNDPFFLLSRSMDEELSDDEQRVLEDALAQSDDLRATVKQWLRLHEIVRAWSLAHPDVDTEPYVKHVVARLGDAESEVVSTDVDALLEHWGETAPDYDDKSFVHGVMDRLGQADAPPERHWSLRRFALPMAAAAALVFAVVGVLRLETKDHGYCLVEYHATTGTIERGSTVDTETAVVVSFVRAQDPARLESSDMRLAFISFGVDASLAELRATPPPL